MYKQTLIAATEAGAKELMHFFNGTFTISNKDLKFYNSNLKYVAEPGNYKLFIGGNSRDVKEADFKFEL